MIINTDCKGNPLDAGDIVYIFTSGTVSDLAGNLGKVLACYEKTVNIETTISRWGCVYRRVLKIPPNLIEAGNIDTIKGYIRLAGVDVSNFHPDNYSLKLPGLRAPKEGY